MNKGIHKNIKIVVVIASLVMVCGLIFAGILLKKNPKADNVNGNEQTRFEASERDTKISVDGSGNLQITRNKPEDTGDYKKGTWTFLMYMCGVDGQKVGYSTLNLDRFKKLNINGENIENYNIIVQTGGNADWKGSSYEYLGTNKVMRIKLNENKEWDVVNDLGKGNMGDSKTLIDFLKWGYTTYPAEHTVLMFNDHGGTGLGGLCFDPYYNDDCITINELEYSLAQTKKYMKNQLDLIGFDVCSAGSVEYANAVAPYAKYMLASPEYITAYGFDNGYALNKIIANPEITPLELGDAYVDGFMENFKHYRINGAKSTAVVYDLGALDDFMVEMNNIFKQAYEYVGKNIRNIKSFHKGVVNGWIYSSQTQVDIRMYLLNISKKIDTTKAINLLKNVYCKYCYGGSIPKDCGMLSICYNGGEFGCGGLNKMRNLTFSPYYFKLIELTSHVLNQRDIDTFVEYDWNNSKYFYEDNFEFMNYLNYKTNTREEILSIINSNSDYVSAGFIQNWVDNIDEKPVDARPVSDTVKASVDSDNKLVAKVTENGEDIESAYNTIYADIQGTTVCLGDNADATYNQETSEVTTNFNGEWLTLGDGQLLTTYILQKQEDFTEYIIPVQANEKESSLYVRVTKDSIDIEGISFEPRNNSFSGRMCPITEGIAITPIYDVWNEEEKTYDTVYGEEYSLKGTDDVLYTYLENGEYSYATIVDNMLGTVLCSKPMKFTMIDKKIKFTK